jgi:glycosidase
MKVLLDWVANHTARDARWIEEKPASWYERDDKGVAQVPWDWSDTAKLNYANHDVWIAQGDAMEFWVREHNVDGFRCDMAMLVPIEFWNEISRRLRAVKPDIFMLAEAEEQNLFEQGAFDACYGWEMHHIMNDVAQQRVRVTALRDYIYRDRERYPNWAMRLTFTSNHDENSWSGSEFERMGAAREIMAVFTFVVERGLPLIYTGQEMGLARSLAFFDRDPLPSYGENPYSEFYRGLITLRRSNPALFSEGGMVEIRNNAEDCLMTFVREIAGNRVVVIMNLSPYTIRADYNTGIYAGLYHDAMSGAPYELSTHVEEDMEGWSYRILSSNGKW